MASCARSCGGRKRKVELDDDVELWGESKDDFIPVKIFCRETSCVGISENHIKQVAYKSCCNPKKLSKCDVFYYTMSKDVSRDIEALQTLHADLRPLEKLEFTTNKRGQVHWKIRKRNMPSDTNLVGQIMLALMGGLKDTDAKSAMMLLITRMIKLLHRNELVKMTGSSSHVSRYSTCYELVKTSSSDESTSKQESDKLACSTPTIKQKLSPESTSPSSSTDSGECQAPKLSTADVLVYSQPLLEQPITTKLVVSIKSNVASGDVLHELLSRLPYQGGHIFGLEINPERAILFSVYPYSEDVVIIYHHHPFEFVSFDEKSGRSTFNFNSFWKMVLAIGHVLQD